MYHVEVLAYQPTFYDFGNTCTEEQAGNVVITATVVGGDSTVMLTNETACQVILYHTKLILYC